ncbi:MAG: PepSY-like domain-containing protein [Chitinophagales bacterium]
MKKIFLMLALIATVAATTVFANDDPKVNPRVQESFKKEFPGAQYVKWDKDQDYFKVIFVLADYRAEAWFSTDGELLGTTRDLLYDQLPLAVMKELEKKFPIANATEIKEVTNNYGTLYKLVLEDKKCSYRISATPNGEISVTEKIKK